MEVRLLHGDCLDVMRELESASVDAVICDPPYGIDYQSARRIDSRLWKPKIANDRTPFVAWLPDAYRLTRSGGCLLCFCRWDVQEEFKQAILLAGWDVKSQVIWDREAHGMGDLEASFAPQHDVIWFAVKGGFKFPGIRPKSVIRAMRLSGEQLMHPNEKPFDLLRQLVRAVTRVGDVVLDCFAGSGVVGEVCVAEGRDYMGVELDPSHYALASARIKRAQGIPADIPRRVCNERATPLFDVPAR